MSKTNVGERIELETRRLAETTDLNGLTRLMYFYFAYHFPNELRKLRQAGVLGQDALEGDGAPWDNIAGHSFLAAMICLVLGTMLALPETVLMRLVRVALRHDEDKRSNRALIRAGKDPSERNQITYDLEIAKTGWGRVTSVRLHDYLRWPLHLVILRLADSMTGRNAANKEAIVAGSKRIAQLVESDRLGDKGHQGHSQHVGELEYDGEDFYDVLLVVTLHCEKVVWKRLARVRPDLTAEKDHTQLDEAVMALITEFLRGFEREIS